MDRVNIIFISVIVIIAAFMLYIFDADDGGVTYASFSTGERGTSVFFDTLQHMGYPVMQGYHPLNRDSDLSDIYIIIQPYAPPVNRQMAEEMLDWVQQGGRLIFLHNVSPSIMDIMLPVPPRRMGGLTLYQWGSGEVVTGRASYVVNRNIMNDSSVGSLLHSILDGWNSNRIWFAEYYHGVRPAETILDNFPLIVRLIIVQLGLFAVMMVWHVGKRFGNAVPYYAEVEREENEHVRALARLYMRADKLRRKQRRGSTSEMDTKQDKKEELENDKKYH